MSTILEEENALPLNNENSSISQSNETNNETKKSKNKNKKNKTKQLDLNSTTEPSSSSSSSLLNDSLSQAIAATIGASTTTSTILAAATQATKKIASETAKKAAKKTKHHTPQTETESLYDLFFPFDSSVTTLLLGLDYIFYFWALLLVLIVGYLTYYQYKQSKAKANASSQEKLTLIEIFVKLVALFIVRPIYYVLKFLYVHLLKNVITSITSDAQLKSIENKFSNNLSKSNDESAFSWLNNCFKWFYFSPETTKIINTSILETLNSVKTQMGQSLQLSAKQQLKFDDVFIKNVDTLPPKFTNIQTVVNAEDNLTLRANVEFTNIDMKVEFKKSKRVIDIRMTSVKSQLLIVLSQNKNHIFCLECSLDPQTDLLIQFDKNQNVETDIMQYFESLIQTTAKQIVLNLELNSFNKTVPSFSLPAKSTVKTPNKPMAPQINTNLTSSTSSTSNTNQTSVSSQAPATVLTPNSAPTTTKTSAFTNLATTAASTFTNSSPTKPIYNTLELPGFTTNNNNNNRQTSSPTSSQSASPTSPLSRTDLINNLLLINNNNPSNNNLNTKINTINPDVANLNEVVNAQIRSYEDENIQLTEQDQPQQRQQNENAFESEVNTIQAIAAAAAAANAKQLRNSVNEKRLLVKLLKATNLTNCEEPYIVVELDYPMQKHITDIHRDMSSINEQFFFDIIANSEELTFSIFDRAKDYGNDLVGEAVIPVNDLCSSLSAKRVIQLHRYGQTKTGSITAEFVFIEPSIHSDQNETRLLSRPTAVRSRSSVSPSPFDSFRSNLSPEKRILMRDELLMPQQLDQYQQKINPEQFSDSDYPSQTRSPLYNENSFNKTMDALYNNSMMQPQQQQQQQQNQNHRSRQQMTPQNRVINRNYLQTQAHNRAKTLDPRGSNLNDYGNIKDELVAGASNDLPINTLDKRKRSISRSLKSLLNKSTSKIFGHKRDKSYDVQNAENEPYDTQSVDNSKKLSNSIKKLFEKKSKNTDVEYNQNASRIGASGGPAISISRPDDSMLINNNQLQFYPNQTNKYYTQPTNNTTTDLNRTMNTNSQIDNSNFSNNLTDDIYNTTQQPVLLRRRYRSP